LSTATNNKFGAQLGGAVPEGNDYRMAATHFTGRLPHPLCYDGTLEAATCWSTAVTYHLDNRVWIGLNWLGAGYQSCKTRKSLAPTLAGAGYLYFN